MINSFLWKRNYQTHTIYYNRTAKPTKIYLTSFKIFWGVLTVSFSLFLLIPFIPLKWQGARVNQINEFANGLRLFFVNIHCTQCTNITYNALVVYFIWMDIVLEPNKGMTSSYYLTGCRYLLWMIKQTILNAYKVWSRWNFGINIICVF